MSQNQYYGATGSGAKTDGFGGPSSGDYGAVGRNGGGGFNNNGSGGLGLEAFLYPTQD
jgi:hypothetical protein